jgi:DNA-binding LytR/AlgR family response regulator
MLPPGEFVRIHRSFVVPVSKIKSFTRQEVRLAGGKALPVGRQYVAAVKDLFKA